MIEVFNFRVGNFMLLLAEGPFITLYYRLQPSLIKKCASWVFSLAKYVGGLFVLCGGGGSVIHGSRCGVDK